jgi:hypothetical protein
MKRKPSKTTLKRKLDRAFSEFIRSRGRCAKCHRSSGVQLQTAHIFSRANLAVRWDNDNALCLCAADHFWAHQNPLLFSKFCEEHLGAERYSQLIMKATMIKKWTPGELEQLLKTLQ